MAVKDLINSGIGFSPGSVKFIITRGLSIGAAVAISAIGAVKVIAYEQIIPKVIQDTRVSKVIQGSGVPKVVK